MPAKRWTPGARIAAAVALGVAGVGAFAPLAWGWLALPLLAALFLLWHGAGIRDGLLIGFGFGCGLFGGGVSWVYFSLHDYGNMPAPLAALSVLGLVFLLALYPALAGAMQAALDGGRRRLHLALVTPVIWVLFEWLREWLLSGFPWLVFGYTQSDTLFAGYAPLAGVHGVGLALALCAGALAAMCFIPARQRLTLLIAPVLLVAGGVYAGSVSWGEPVGAPLPVAVLQGNVSLRRKWAEGAAPVVREHYLALSREALQGGDPSRRAALVVWPEGAIPGYRHEVPEAFWRRLRASGADHVVGVLEHDDDDDRRYNSALAIRSGGGTDEAVYRKEHLVPFGEYLPLRPLFGWMLNYLEIPMANFSPWRGPQAPLQAAGVPLGVSICFEDAFPEQIRSTLPAARLLVNLSEDAWFGNSLAPHQRLQMARMRAMESARYMVRAANTGPSALIDARGTVLAQSAQFESTVLRGTVQPLRGATPYADFGNTLVIALLAFLMALAAKWPRRWRG